jgi:hypothetical protein
MRYRFAYLAIIFFAAVFTIENVNGRFWLNDFRVYYDAADAFLSGGQVYGKSFGLDTGFYKYSPFALLFFVPFTLLPYSAAAVCHFIFVSAAAVMAIRAVQKMAGHFWGDNLQKQLSTTLAFLAVINHLVRELHLGNVNMILVLVLSASMLMLLRKKDAACGLLLAIAILFKPYLGIFGFPMLLHGRLRAIVSCVASVTICCALVDLFAGVTRGMLLHHEWITAMAAHDGYLASNHTVGALLGLDAISIPGGSAGHLLLAVVIIVYAFLHYQFSLRKGKLSEYDMLVASFALLALIPNILTTDTEHFLFSLPLIVLMINRLISIKNIYATLIFVVLVVLYGFNSSDLLGRQFSEAVEANGVLGLANLAIVGFSLYHLAFSGSIRTTAHAQNG